MAKMQRTTGPSGRRPPKTAKPTRHGRAVPGPVVRATPTSERIIKATFVKRARAMQMLADR